MSDPHQDPLVERRSHQRLLAERTIPLEEAAELYGLSTYTLRRWIADGKVKGYRFGPRMIRVETDALEAMFEPLGPGE